MGVALRPSGRFTYSESFISRIRYFVRNNNKVGRQNIMSKLRETFLDELKDIYNAEKQLTKALPKLANAAEHQELKDAFESHLEETETHIERLEQVFKLFGETPKGKTCKAMEGLVEEGSELIEEEAGDAAYIAGAQKVEHYEIATYGTLKTWAELMGESEAAELLAETLDEEKAADEKLTGIAESTINAEENESEEDEQPEKQSRRGRSKVSK